MRVRLVAGTAACVVAGAGAVAALVSTQGADPADGAAPTHATSTVPVRRGDLVDTTSASGSLEYGDVRDIASEVAGTVTWLPPTGELIREGAVLYRVDTVPVLRLDGTVPAWRALGPGVSDGADVKQLEAALLDLGYGVDHDMTADGEWTWVTTLAVQQWQEDLGLEETGELALGTVVFSDGNLRVGGPLVDVGTRVQPTTPVLEVSGVDRRVTVSLEPSRRSLVPVGGSAHLDFADGATARGRIVDVEIVPAADDQSEDSLAVTVEPVGRRSLKRVAKQLDGASVQVSFTVTVAQDVLIVPVTALVAVRDGYAVEVLEDGGSSRMVAVTTDGFADSSVAVVGDLAADDEVVVP